MTFEKLTSGVSCCRVDVIVRSVLHVIAISRRHAVDM